MEDEKLEIFILGQTIFILRNIFKIFSVEFLSFMFNESMKSNLFQAIYFILENEKVLL